MKKIIRLTESELIKVIKQVLNEQSLSSSFDLRKKPSHPDPKDLNWGKSVPCFKNNVGDFRIEFNGTNVYKPSVSIEDTLYFYDGSVFQTLGGNNYIKFWYCDGNDLKIDDYPHFEMKYPPQSSLYSKELKK